jgi:hypothetical protein
MLSFVPLCRHLDLDPDDPVVELLESSDLLVNVGAKLIRQIAMSGLDDNIHVYLHRGVGSSKDALDEHASGVRYRPWTAPRGQSRNDEGTRRTQISA